MSDAFGVFRSRIGIRIGILRRELTHQEFYANRFADFDALAGGFEFASFGIDLEDHDAVRVLVGRQEPAAARVDAEIARRLALRGLDLNACELAAGAVDGECSDA